MDKIIIALIGFSRKGNLKLHLLQKFIIFQKVSIFRRIWRSFRGFGLLFADSGLFSRIRASFHGFGSLFADLVFFSRIRISFRGFGSLFADSDLFSRIRASFHGFGSLFTDSAPFSRIRSPFRGFGFLFIEYWSQSFFQRKYAKFCSIIINKKCPEFRDTQICNHITLNRSQTISFITSKVPLKEIFHSCQNWFQI